MDEAADEIEALRAMLTRQSESSHDAVRLMGDYAHRYGFILGGLEMVAAGHTTAEAVLARARGKYDQPTLTDDERKAVARAAAIADEFHDARLAATLRGLLERLG